MDVIILLALAAFTAVWLFVSMLSTSNERHVMGSVITGLIFNGMVLYIVHPVLFPVTCIFFLLFNLILAIGFCNNGFSEENFNFGSGCVLILFCAVLVFAVVLGPILCAHPLSQILDVNDVPDDNLTINNEHIRLVSYETALWHADKVIGNIGYKVGISEPDIQYINDTLTWLVPLDYNSPVKSFIYAIDGTGGYVIVSAEDPYEEPKLVTGIPMRYTPNAIFGHDLRRSIWYDYPSYKLIETTFQLDNNQNPKWVTTAVTPAMLGCVGYVIRGIIVTDPVTGINEFYYKDNIPSWIQRIYSEELIEKYIIDWGKYQDGWLNSVISQKDVKRPTGDVHTVFESDGPRVINGYTDSTDVYLILGNNNRTYWFSAITSPGKDASMVGYMLCDAITGNSYYYTTEGYYNDLGAAQNVQQSQQVAMATGLCVVQPIMYTFNTHETWVIPVVSQTGEIQLVGMLDARTGQMTVQNSFGAAYDILFGENMKLPKSSDSCSIQERIAEIRASLDLLEQEILSS